MQRLEVSGAVRPIYESLGVKRLSSAVHCPRWFLSMGLRRLHSKVDPPPSGAPWVAFYKAR